MLLLEDDVEIGANTTIDRATMGSTIIRKGVKIDNLVQVAHNVEIMANTVIAAQTGISGSTRVGENCIIGGQAGMVGHIQIAKGTQIQAQSGISRSLTGRRIKNGPAHRLCLIPDNLRSQVIINRLPALEKKINELEKLIAELEKKSLVH